MPEFTLKKKLLVLAPMALTVFMGFVYLLAVQWFGLKTGGFAGFVVYWLGWGVLFSLIYIRPKGIVKSMFSFNIEKFDWTVWLAVLFAAAQVVVTIVTMFAVKIPTATSTVIVMTLVQGIINGVMEEIIWRGTYIIEFGDDLFFAWIFPSVGFAVWHSATELIYASSPMNGLLFILGPVALGLTYGWIGWKTKSILIPIIAHIMIDVFAMGGDLFV